MILMGDTMVMFGLLLIAFLLVVGPLAVYYGTDSRVDDVARRRRIGA